MMKLVAYFRRKKFFLLFLIQFAILCHVAPTFSYPINFEDSRGNTFTINGRPLRVVSLVPSISEILFEIGAGDAVQAITYHTALRSKTSEKTIIGGFFSPSLARIERLNPDIIFYSKIHKEVWERFHKKECLLVNLETNSIADSFKNIFLLGRIFNKEIEAQIIIDGIKDQLQIIKKKATHIPDSKRKRVIRFMGIDPLTVPGDDSFQNEFIRAAAGISPKFNKQGNIVTISRKEWIKFNPQVIYGCGSDIEAAKKFFNSSEWKDVEAVKKGAIYKFPCDLTCRAATNTGFFVSWLSSRIYQTEFSKKENQVLENKIFQSRKLDIHLDYIKDVRISYSHIYDFTNKTLIIDFKTPLSIVSTLEGQRDGIESVGNQAIIISHLLVGLSGIITTLGT